MHAARFRMTKSNLIGAVALVAASLVPALANAQSAKYSIAPRASLAWWQISPHMNHLWATTCPGDPNWQPGDERSSGWKVDEKKMPPTGHSNKVDTVHVPLYPRPEANEACTPAVRGDITVQDMANWKGVKGMILVRGDQLITGLDMRDNYARKAILQTSAYPDVKFEIDSLTNIRHRGDTVIADAVGTLEIRAVRAPKKVQIQTWTEPLGRRVTAKFMFPGTDLAEVYKISRLSLGLGVGTGLWKFVHLGIDAILVPAGSASSSD